MGDNRFKRETRDPSTSKTQIVAKRVENNKSNDKDREQESKWETRTWFKPDLGVQRRSVEAQRLAREGAYEGWSRGPNATRRETTRDDASITGVL